jgi:hypothetical protein
MLFLQLIIYLKKCLKLKGGKKWTQFGEIITNTNLSMLKEEVKERGGGITRGQTVTICKKELECQVRVPLFYQEVS